jgi:hypothetical protein
MKTSGRENPNSRARLCNEPSPRSGKPKPFALVQKGWKVRNYPAGGEVFFLTFPFIELHRWDEKAGLQRDAIRSQCSTCSRHKEKETGYEKD